MSERWKPAIENVYWIVDFGFIKLVRPLKWDDDNIDNRIYNSGNCFKTEAEAKDAAEKVKALLLSLHGECENLQPTCNQLATNLPKLTAEVFDRPDCPEWAKYAAVNGNNTATWFNDKPIYDGNKRRLWLCKATPYYNEVKTIPGSWDASDWQNSLIERPAKLPDWCKDGSLAWENGDYFKLGVIDADHRVTMMYSDGTEESVDPDYIVKHVSPARLRPYNAEEMKKLVGKIICETNASHVATTCIHHDGTDYLRLGIHLYEAEELISKGFTIDGKPCGVLEHLEDGRWVR